MPEILYFDHGVITAEPTRLYLAREGGGVYGGFASDYIEGPSDYTEGGETMWIQWDAPVHSVQYQVTGGLNGSGGEAVVHVLETDLGFFDNRHGSGTFAVDGDTRWIKLRGHGADGIRIGEIRYVVPCPIGAPA